MTSLDPRCRDPHLLFQALERGEDLPPFRELSMPVRYEVVRRYGALCAHPAILTNVLLHRLATVIETYIVTGDR